MRIIGGLFRGKKIEWVCDATTRPTPDRVKENIFNILTSHGTNFVTANVLVLFSGTGQMGLECISRGTTKITFNDTDTRARELIKKNCTAIKHNPKIYDCDYMQTLEKLRGQKFDLVFLDPPFRDQTACTNSAEFLLKNQMLNPNATIIVETDRDNFQFDGFETAQRKYGREIIYFLGIA